MPFGSSNDLMDSSVVDAPGGKEVNPLSKEPASVIDDCETEVGIGSAGLIGIGPLFSVLT